MYFWLTRCGRASAVLEDFVDDVITTESGKIDRTAEAAVIIEEGALEEYTCTERSFMNQIHANVVCVSAVDEDNALLISEREIGNA